MKKELYNDTREMSILEFVTFCPEITKSLKNILSRIYFSEGGKNAIAYASVFDSKIFWVEVDTLDPDKINTPNKEQYRMKTTFYFDSFGCTDRKEEKYTINIQHKIK